MIIVGKLASIYNVNYIRVIKGMFLDMSVRGNKFLYGYQELQTFLCLNHFECLAQHLEPQKISGTSQRHNQRPMGTF
ncbi:hypothetical protein QW180_08735 [Vibrio sinaloensis]|nr:hypothetical protein [Vibrio sinaloensis]